MHDDLDEDREEGRRYDRNNGAESSKSTVGHRTSLVVVVAVTGGGQITCTLGNVRGCVSI